MKFTTAALVSIFFYLAAATPIPDNDNPADPYKLGECVKTLDGCTVVTHGWLNFPLIHVYPCDPNAKCKSFLAACTWLEGNEFANCT